MPGTFRRRQTWMTSLLVDKGVMSEQGLTRRAKLIPHRPCGLVVLAGLDSDRAALDVWCDLGELTLHGEAMALLEGRRTYELHGGRLVHASLGLARRLLDPRCALLAALARAFPFELAVGVNGLVWAAAAEDVHADAVAEALAAAEGLDEVGCEAAARAAAGRAAAAASGEGGASKRARGGS